MTLPINSKFISFVWWVLAPVLTALLISSMIAFLLQKESINDDMSVDYQKTGYLKYYPKFLNSYRRANKRVLSKVKKVERLGRMVLQACYSEQNKKFIVFKEGAETVFLDLNQSYKGARLVDVGLNYAIFSKYGKKIELKLEDMKPERGIKQSFEKNLQQGNYINVKRDEFKKYTKNIKRALRDIRIQELKKRKKFIGIRLSFIRKGSLFDRMKLKVGDIIKSIDGNELRSMMDLLPYYNRIDDTATLQIGFERNNEMKEIVYEIN